MSLVTAIPNPVRASSSQAGARLFTGSGEAWDFAIGGLPFNGAASEQRPLVRQTAPSRKDQTDQSREPGEHSLAFWWTKAQSSFHGGAGQKYLDLAEDGTLEQYRFSISANLDVFTEPGKVTLAPSVFRLVASAAPLIASSDEGDLFVADGTSLTRQHMSPSAGQPDHPSSAMDYSSDTVAWGGATPILSLAAAGGRYVLATHEGIYIGTGVGAATKVYNLPANSVPLVRYVKQRLILALSGTPGAVYELDALATAGSALPAPLFSTDGPWAWSAITETPSAILLSGDNGTRSAIHRVLLDSSGAVPVLRPGVVAAEFPPGEYVRGMATYLGSVLGIQTSAGFRAAVLGDSGEFQYGSLLFTHDWGTDSGGVFGADNSLYVGWTNKAGQAGLARVDLSDTIGNARSLRFPWAPFMASNVPGKVTDATLWDYGRRVFVVKGQGVYVQGDSSATSGTLTTSRIRWSTLEPKVVRSLRVRGEGATGRIAVEVARDSDVNFTTVGAIDVARQADSGDMTVQIPPAQFVTLRLTISGAASLTGYQLKALPAQRRQRFLQIPLNCFDREVDNSGQIVGADGAGMQRLLALERLEQSGDIVALQWLNARQPQELTEYVTIEQVEFSQTSGPSDRKGWGGIVTLTLRTVS